MENHPKVVAYCRVATAEQLSSSDRHRPIVDEKAFEKAKEKINNSSFRYKYIHNYKPYKGFVDLRQYNIPKEDFSLLWKAQDFLYFSNQEKDRIKKSDPILWNKLKELSGIYQQQLFSYPLKPEEKNQDDFDLEMDR